ncbi:MAG: O-methyltransferase [Bacteroidales bacterium]|nr:O-methyltransferase [Bacteroidales bacterium]MDD4602259.1 O-methyltransferase [Bacteroidales bacterium]
MITPELIEYAENHSTPELPILEKLTRETHLTRIYPRMLAGQLQGTFLRFVSEMLKPRRILEIGTFTGYSSINFACGLVNDGVLHTIEVDPEQEDIIRRYISETGMDNKIILHIGDAKTVIPTLHEQWDLVYIDADKPHYLDYYKMVLDQLRPGGFLLADNALWDGKVLHDRSKMNKDTTGIDDFNKYVQQDDRVENVLLPFRDGMMMIRKK